MLLVLKQLSILRSGPHSFDRKWGVNGEKAGPYERLRNFIGATNQQVFNKTTNFLLEDFFLQLDGNKGPNFADYVFSPSNFFDVVLEDVLKSSELWKGKNQFTIGSDMYIYEVPDINRAGIKYNFMNMRRYGSTILNRIEEGEVIDLKNVNIKDLQSVGFVDRNDYFPIIPIGKFDKDVKWKFILTENDKKYSKFSGKGISLFGGKVRNIKVWVYDMNTDAYNFENVSLEAKGHIFGNSDDIFEKSAVKNITSESVKNQLLYKKEIVISKNGFEMVLVLEQKELIFFR